jgi:uncharacterized membrane protein
MGQDPNQPYPGQYGQPSGTPPPPPYPGGYQQPPPNSYQPPNPGFQQQGYQPPNTGYQQQQQGYAPPNPGYQQPYGQPGPMYNVGHPNGPSTMNMEPNTAAGLSYFTWIAGLIFFLVEKQNRFVRFNAMQELLLTGVFVAADIIVLFIPFVGFLLYPLVSLAGFVLWIICVINAFQGKYFKLPVIGDYAERFANSGTPGIR